MTTFSIVTVVRNDLPGLTKTARSLADQTFPDLEWIVIDGESTAAHQVDIDALPVRPEIFVSEEDSGIYDAMNKGWSRASGDWILFLNAGDVLCQPRTLQDVAEALMGSQALWAFGLVRNVDAFGRLVGIQNASPFNRYGQALGNTTVPHQATLVRTNLLRSVGGFRSEFGTAADQELIFRFARLGKPEELVWPIADFQLGGRGMQGSWLTPVLALRKARATQRDYWAGNSFLDLGATLAVCLRRLVQRKLL